MVFTKGNKFGEKKKKTILELALEVVDTAKNVHEQSKMKYFLCSGCLKKLTGPMAHLIDLCTDCVQKKQPGGVFAEYKYISGTSVKK